VATDPVEDPIVIISIQTYYQGYANPVMLGEGDHPFITRASIPAFQFFECLNRAALKADFDSGRLVLHPHVVTTKLLDRILTVACTVPAARDKLPGNVLATLHGILERRRKAG